MYALISGASRGIGKEISKALLQNGYKDLANAREFSKWDKKEKNFIPITVDLNDFKEVEKKIRSLQNYPISLLVHSAGEGIFGYVKDHKTDQIISSVNVHLTSVFLLTKLLVKSIEKTKGQIIFISSTSAKVASPFGAVYSSLKAALMQFNRSLFEEIG